MPKHLLHGLFYVMGELWASKGDAPCRASSLLPWRTNHPRSGCRASDVQQTQRTNVHFVDIVRPSLEDFQPIALRLRLAFLGIYIAKAVR